MKQEPINDIENNRLYMYDNETKLHFLIDTGAELSVLPRMYHCKARPANCKLYAVNVSEIQTYGEKLLKVNLGLRRVFK